MPYDIVKVGRDGYKVCQPDSSKCVSKKPVSLEKAKKQQAALYAKETKIRGKRLDSVSNTPTGQFTAVISANAAGEGSPRLTYSGSKRDVANYIAKYVGEPATSILNRIAAKGSTTFGQPVKVVVSANGMEGAGLFDWLKTKGAQVFEAAKTGISKIIENTQNNTAPTTQIGDNFMREQTKLFSPSGREDEPGIPPQEVIQNFQPNQYMPSTKVLYQMNKNAYANSDENVDGWDVMDSTPTIIIYNRGPAMLVAVRGTADNRDILTDLTIAAQDMENQPRYKEDKQFLQQFQAMFPQSQYTYLFTGHSLGGAICDQLIRDGLGIQAITFNPAVQKSAYDSQTNKRIYQADDPLYRMMGRYCRYNVEVRNNRNKSAIESALSAVPIAGVGYTAMQAHSLDNYVGGMMYPTSIEDRPHMRPFMSPFSSASDMVGSGRAYTAEQWKAKLCEGEDSLLSKKIRLIAQREAAKQARQRQRRPQYDPNSPAYSPEPSPRPRIKQEPVDSPRPPSPRMPAYTGEDLQFLIKREAPEVVYTGRSNFERWIRGLLDRGREDKHKCMVWTYNILSALPPTTYVVDRLKSHKLLLMPTDIPNIGEFKNFKPVHAELESTFNFMYLTQNKADLNNMKKQARDLVTLIQYSLVNDDEDTKYIPIIVRVALKNKEGTAGHMSSYIFDKAHNKVYHYDPHGLSLWAGIADALGKGIAKGLGNWEYIGSAKWHDSAGVVGFQREEAGSSARRPASFFNVGSCSDWNIFLTLAILKQMEDGVALKNKNRMDVYLQNINKLLTEIYSEQPRTRPENEWVNDSRLRLAFGVQEDCFEYWQQKWGLSEKILRNANKGGRAHSNATILGKLKDMFVSLTLVYQAQINDDFIACPTPREIKQEP